jgi:molybdopterin-guanine dinucleotide biosynthesis protein/uncharacterized protein (UPF0335 family)
MAFKKATKKQSRLRAGVSGPAGSGKTLTSIKIARGLCGDEGRIAVIDTEKGSACKYGGKFDFDVSEISDYSVTSMISEIQEAARAGYDVLIVDSLTHTWQWVKAEVDDYARKRCKGNTYMAWKHGTPLWDGVIQAILDYPGHVLVTMRSKMDYVLEEYEVGGYKKTRPVKVGLAPEARNGTEYEWDVQIDMTHDHLATVSKDRTGTIDGEVFDKPGREVGEKLAAWLNDGEESAEDKQRRAYKEIKESIQLADTVAEIKEVFDAARQEGFPKSWMAAIVKLATERKNELAPDPEQLTKEMTTRLNQAKSVAELEALYEHIENNESAYNGGAEGLVVLYNQLYAQFETAPEG